jgi:hypothetical protein
MADPSRQWEHVENRDGIIEGLVGQALDDLDAGRLDTTQALRLIAEAAWSAGYADGRDDGATEGPADHAS